MSHPLLVDEVGPTAEVPRLLRRQVRLCRHRRVGAQCARPRRAGGGAGWFTVLRTAHLLLHPRDGPFRQAPGGALPRGRAEPGVIGVSYWQAPAPHPRPGRTPRNHCGSWLTTCCALPRYSRPTVPPPLPTVHPRRPAGAPPRGLGVAPLLTSGFHHS